MIDVSTNLNGIDAVSAALRGAQPEVRKATVPVMEMAATSIAARARSSADPSSPRGLWSAGRGRRLSPKYGVKRRGPYWFRVETPGGAAGKAETMAEFARLAVTPQGAALVRALDSKYGRHGGSGGGRILWQSADDMSADILSSLESAVAAAAVEIESQAGGA